MIVFAGIVPHSPLLIPSIGKENLTQMQQTTDAMRLLSEELYATHPDTIVLISTHAAHHAEAFSVNLHDTYAVDLSGFGDMDVGRTFLGDTVFASMIQQQMQSDGIPFTLDSNAMLDYGSGVPLLLLTESLPQVKVVPVSVSGLDAKDHVAFGKALKDVCEQSSKRIAIIASGDLSHCVTKDAPMGFREEGPVYDQQIVSAVTSLSTSVLLNMDEALRSAAHECVHDQLLVLFGALERKQAKVHLLSYEHPFGVGYLVVHMHL